MTLSIRNMFDVAGEAPQGDVFATFGESAAPAHRGHSSDRYAVKHTADLSPLEKKLREKQRLSKEYLKGRTIRRRAVLDQEPRLRDFARYLRSVPANGDDLPSVLAGSWLPRAPQDVRLLALELTTRRCDQINRMHGFIPLDDPLPVEMGGCDDTRVKCARILYPHGRY